MGIFGFILSFLLISLSASLLPYRLPNVFETSTINQRLGGIPVITIIGVLSLALVHSWTGCFCGTRAPASTASPGWSVFNIVVFLSGLVIYYVAKWIRSRQGIDVSLSFKEIPEE